jgi:hypothetical protein
MGHLSRQCGKTTIMGKTAGRSHCWNQVANIVFYMTFIQRKQEWLRIRKEESMTFLQTIVE